MYILLAFLT